MRASTNGPAVEPDLREKPREGELPWRRTLFVMAATQAIMSLTVSVSWPFLPLYVVELGIHPISQASLWAGIISAPQFLIAAIVSPFWGALADRIGRKAMVLRCALATAFFTALMAAAQDVWQMLALTIMYGIFSGFYGAAIALVGTQVPEERLGYSLGWMSTAQLAGTLSGPLVGGLLADSLHSYRAVYVFSAIGASVAVAVALLFVHEGRSPHSSRAARLTGGPRGGSFRAVFATREFAPMIVVMLLANIAAGAVSPIIAPYTRLLLGHEEHWVATAAGAAIAVTGLAGLASAPLLGRHSDRIGYRTMLLVSLAGAALFTLPQALAHTLWLFILLRSGVGVFLGGILPTANAWAGRLFSREERGRIYGITAGATSLGNFFGPLTGGLVAAHFGFAAVFLVVGVLMLANLVWVGFATAPKGSRNASAR